MVSTSITGLVLTFILASLCLSSSALVKNDEHNLAVGERRPNDQKLYEKHVSIGLIWFTIRDETVCYPDQDNNDIRITAIECINNADEKQYSGSAKLTEGGVGKSRACVYLEGYRGSPLYFRCKFYGYKKSDFGDDSTMDWVNDW